LWFAETNVESSGGRLVEDNHLDSLFDAFIREPSRESILALGAALADRTPGESSFAQEREGVNELFSNRIADLKAGGKSAESNTETFLNEKLYELRHWLAFLRHRYAGARAAAELGLELLRSGNAVERIHSLRIEQAGRSLGDDKFREIRKILDSVGRSVVALQKTGKTDSLKLSRASYRRARRFMFKVYLRSFRRALQRHIFLLVGGFFIGSYLLEALPEMLTESGKKPIKALVGAFAVWILDRWLISPIIDRVLARWRIKHLRANLSDLYAAFMDVHLSRVFSSYVLHTMLDSANTEYNAVVKRLMDPHFPMGRYGIGQGVPNVSAEQAMRD